MRLRTTTWKERNTGHLNDALEQSKKLGLYEPTILNYGPGGGIPFLMNFMPAGTIHQWTSSQKIQRTIVKASETLIRHTQLFALATSEPYEIATLLKELNPAIMHVLDKEPKVIDAARNNMATVSQRINLNYHVIDAQIQQPQLQGQIVIAYNMIEVTQNPLQCLENIAATVAPRGILSTTYPGQLPNNFQKIAPNTYLRQQLT